MAVATFGNRTDDPNLGPVGPMAADLIRQSLLHTAIVEIASRSTPTRSVDNGGSNVNVGGCVCAVADPLPE